MAGNNAINNNAISLLGPSFVGVNYATGYVNINSGSNTIVYTCPTGKRAYALSCMVRNPTGSPIDAIAYLRSGGVDYQLIQTLSISANSSLGEQSFSTAGWQGLSIVLDAGESIVFNGNGLNIFMTMYEYANNVPVFSAKSLTLPSSTNVLYTVPANKSARIGINSISMPGIYYKNNGSARTATAYVVPSGGSAGSTNQYGTTTSLNLSVFNANQGSAFTLDAGDFIQINVTVTGNAVSWVNVWELG